MTPHRHLCPWTESEKDRLRELRGKGLSVGVIATIMGRDEEAVRMAAVRYVRGVQRKDKRPKPGPVRVKLAGYTHEAAIWAAKHRHTDPEAAIIWAIVKDANRVAV